MKLEVFAKFFGLAEVKKEIVLEIAKKMNQVFDYKMRFIVPYIKFEVEKAIINSPEYQGLLYSRGMYSEIGYPQLRSFLLNMVETIVKNVDIEINKFRVIGERVEGGLNIGILKDDYSDILNLPGGDYSTEKGENIPWLSWLLFQGTRKVIAGYHYFWSPKTGQRSSRTGEGIMIQGGDWEISSEFAGTAENNFLTRALRPLDSKLSSFLTGLF